MKGKSRNMRTMWIRMAVLIGAIGLVMFALSFVPLMPFFEWLEEWTQSRGMFAPLAFACVYIIAGSLFVPDTLLRLAAGAILGLFWGFVVASVSLTVVAAIGFLIGRYFARDALRRHLKEYPRFAAIDNAIGAKGWKVVALLRLVPFYPYNVGNYAFGITAIRFQPYVVATWAARLPGTFVMVYLGYVGRVAVESAARDRVILEPESLIVLGVGFAAAVAATVYITLLARKALRKYVDEEEEESA